MKIILAPIKYYSDNNVLKSHNEIDNDVKGWLTIDGKDYHFDVNGMDVDVGDVKNPVISGKVYGYDRPEKYGYPYSICTRIDNICSTTKNMVQLNLALRGPVPVYVLYEL